MTPLYTSPRTMGKLLLTAITLAASTAANAQSYSSNFSNPAGKFEVSSPSGTLCLAPGVTNDANIADADMTNYATVSGLLGVGVICSNTTYAVKSKLNFPVGTTQAPAGYQAGFRARFGSLIPLSTLVLNTSMRTYLNGSLQETIAGTSLMGLSLLALGNDADVYAITTLPFDEVELVFNTTLLPIGIAFDYRLYYAFGRPEPLPVSLTRFNAVAESKTIQLKWTTTTELNTARFEVERSEDNTRFYTMGTVAAKGNSSTEVYYSFVDRSVVAKQYFYRLKLVNKDGSAEYSKVISVKNASADGVKIYPTLVKAGSNLQITFAENITSNVAIIIINQNGQKVASYNLNSSINSIMLNNLQKGIYMVRVMQQEKSIATEKIIIQ